MNFDVSSGVLDPDAVVDQLIREYDGEHMPIPDIEYEPHLLISKVRKHYMDYLIKLLSLNYETNQKLINKNIYLPSAIWRCAKILELKAVQSCMVVQIYRKYIVSIINELKTDTNKGKLNKKLYECLHIQPENEKKVQTTLNSSEDCNCQCNCKVKRRRRKATKSPNNTDRLATNPEPFMPQEFSLKHKISLKHDDPIVKEVTSDISSNLSKLEHVSNKSATRMSVESQDSDELMMQLERLFQADPNDDDLFDGALCDTVDAVADDEIMKKYLNDNTENPEALTLNTNQDSMIENHAAQIKSLDERLASLAVMLTHNPDSNNSSQLKNEPPKAKKIPSNKWLCEEYFLKKRYYELLDQIGDSNRKKLSRIKEMLVQLFGEDSDDEGMISPLEETPEFTVSCKERIAPWVVKLLTPYYIKGRIKGKTLFKALAKHLIRVIYQCSHYPNEFEVKSFVSDFLESHKLIRCEADFKQFKIENI